jgi:hypothetical protein
MVLFFDVEEWDKVSQGGGLWCIKDTKTNYIWQYEG